MSINRLMVIIVLVSSTYVANSFCNPMRTRENYVTKQEFECRLVAIMKELNLLKVD